MLSFLSGGDKTQSSERSEGEIFEKIIGRLYKANILITPRYYKCRFLGFLCCWGRGSNIVRFQWLCCSGHIRLRRSAILLL